MDLGTRPPLEVSLDPSQSQRNIDIAVVNKARNNFILRYQKSSIYLVLILVVGLGFAIKSHVNQVYLYIWGGLMFATYISRYLLCLSFVNSDETDQGDDKWEILFSINVIASGLLWGLSAFLIFPENSKNHQLLLLIVVVFLCAGTIVTHSGYRLASIGFAIACLCPVMAKLVLTGEEGLMEASALLLLFLLVMMSSGLQLRKTSNKIFLLSYENSKLIDELKGSNSELLEKNEMLSNAQEALREVNDELQKLATTDALTGLTNRRRFEALANVKWSRCADAKMPLSLLIINIDRFKQYNDFYGQRKGDSCLIKIADLLKHTPEINRSGDSISRYSGDEIGVLLVDADETYARRAAEEIRQGVEKLRLSRAELPNDVSPWLSVSIGIATESKFVDMTSEDLFSRADETLHNAKRSGRNRVSHSSELGAA